VASPDPNHGLGTSKAAVYRHRPIVQERVLTTIQRVEESAGRDAIIDSLLIKLSLKQVD
jgi:hypothetical protein